MTTNKTIFVKTLERKYPIYIGKDLFAQPELEKSIANKAIIVTDEQVAKLYLAPLKNALEKFACESIILKAGEQSKTLENFEKIVCTLADKHYHRDTTLIALGGGVITDITGFSAACYQRGIPFISYPTTLLAQIDASIGGKTGVNLPQGKNLVGAFYQPHAVFIDMDTLKSLPDREFYAGIAEIIKAALIQDELFFLWLEENINALLKKEEHVLMHAIETACIIKRDIVENDEKEQDIRMLLNLGHTFAHAIETCTGYSQWLHGEAVAMGLILAAKLSYQLKGFALQNIKRLEILLQKTHLPTEIPPSLDIECLLKVMKIDKKIKANRLRFILLEKIGKALVCDVAEQELLKLLK